MVNFPRQPSPTQPPVTERELEQVSPFFAVIVLFRTQGAASQSNVHIEPFVPESQPDIFVYSIGEGVSPLKYIKIKGVRRSYTATGKKYDQEK